MGAPDDAIEDDNPGISRCSIKADLCGEEEVVQRLEFDPSESTARENASHYKRRLPSPAECPEPFQIVSAKRPRHDKSAGSSREMADCQNNSDASDDVQEVACNSDASARNAMTAREIRGNVKSDSGDSEPAAGNSRIPAITDGMGAVSTKGAVTTSSKSVEGRRLSSEGDSSVVAGISRGAGARPFGVSAKHMPGASLAAKKKRLSLRRARESSADQSKGRCKKHRVQGVRLRRDQGQELRAMAMRTAVASRRVRLRVECEAWAVQQREPWRWESHRTSLKCGRASSARHRNSEGCCAA